MIQICATNPVKPNCLVSINPSSTVDLNIDIDPKCYKGNIWAKFIYDILRFFHNDVNLHIADPDITKGILFGKSDMIKPENMAFINYEPLDQVIGLSKKHHHLNRLFLLYRGLSNREMNDEAFSICSNVEEKLRKVPTEYIHNRRFFSFDSVLNEDGIFDINTSIAKMIKSINDAIKSGNWKVAVSIANVLSLEVTDKGKYQTKVQMINRKKGE